MTKEFKLKAFKLGFEISRNSTGELSIIDRKSGNTYAVVANEAEANEVLAEYDYLQEVTPTMGY